MLPSRKIIHIIKSSCTFRPRSVVWNFVCCACAVAIFAQPLTLLLWASENQHSKKSTAYQVTSVRLEKNHEDCNFELIFLHSFLPRDPVGSSA